MKNPKFNISNEVALDFPISTVESVSLHRNNVTQEIEYFYNVRLGDDLIIGVPEVALTATQKSSPITQEEKQYLYCPDCRNYHLRVDVYGMHVEDGKFCSNCGRCVE